MQIAASQRERILGAVIQIVAERGYAALRVREIVTRAGVSSRTFYELYEDKQDCFLEAHRMIALRSAHEVLVAGAADKDFELQLRAALVAFIALLTRRPGAARLALVEALGGGEAARRQMRESLAIYEKLLQRRFAAAPDGVSVPPVIVSAIVAGIARVCRARLLADRAHELPDIAEELAGWTLSLRCEQVATVVRLPSTRARLAPRVSQPVAPGSRDERERLLAAAIRLAAGDGSESVTATRLRAVTGVGRKRFEQHFNGARDCLQQAVQWRIEEALGRAASAGGSAPDWPRGVHRAMSEFCALLSADSDLARAALIELPAGGTESLLPRDEFVAKAAELLRASAPPRLALTEVRAQASLAAAWAVMHRLVADGRLRQLPPSAATLSFLILAPVIGGERALDAITTEANAGMLSAAGAVLPRLTRHGTGAGALELSG